METFRSFDGLEIAYLDAGQGPAVILSHGFAADHRINWVVPGVVDALGGLGAACAGPGCPRPWSLSQAARPRGLRRRRHGARHPGAAGSSRADPGRRGRLLHGVPGIGPPRPARAQGPLPHPRGRRRSHGPGPAPGQPWGHRPGHGGGRRPAPATIPEPGPFGNLPSARGPTAWPWPLSSGRRPGRRRRSGTSPCRPWSSPVTPMCWSARPMSWPGRFPAPPTSCSREPLERGRRPGVRLVHR